MKIYEINDLSNTKVIDILKSGITQNMFKNKKLFENYLYSHKDSPANLFYLLQNGRYKTGSYFVITEDDDSYVASAGWNQYDKDTALLLTRMLVIPEYRSSYIIGHTILNTMIDQAKVYDKVWVTFNHYNKTLYDWFERVDQGKTGALFNDWPDVYRKFKPIGEKIINNVPQYVVELKDR